MKVLHPSRLIAPLLLLPFALSAEVHMWTSKAGTVLEAEMTGVDVTARTISLKKTDGSVITIPIDALSDADKSYAATEWKKMQAMPPAAPTAAKAPAAAPATPAPSTAPASPAAAPAAPAPAAGGAGKPAPARPALAILPAKTFKAPNSADYVSKVLKTRPRLLHAQTGWSALKSLIATDPNFAKMVANLKAGGEKLLEAPELTRVFGEQRGTVTPGSKAMYRMAALGALHFLDGDPRWKERAIRNGRHHRPCHLPELVCG